jgi:uncharacterized membrane protein YbhN (UPF0104 family)
MLRREPVTLGLRYRDLLIITGYWALSWIVGGVGFYLLIRSLADAPTTIVAVVLAIGINAIGWDVGFLAILTPSGLGFREAAIAGLLIACGAGRGVHGAVAHHRRRTNLCDCRSPGPWRSPGAATNY